MAGEPVCKTVHQPPFLWLRATQTLIKSCLDRCSHPWEADALRRPHPHSTIRAKAGILQPSALGLQSLSAQEGRHAPTEVASPQLLGLRAFCAHIDPMLQLFAGLFFSFYCISFKNLNYSLHSILFCIGFRCTAQWLDNRVLYKVVSLVFPAPAWHHTQPLQGP